MQWINRIAVRRLAALWRSGCLALVVMLAVSPRVDAQQVCRTCQRCGKTFCNQQQPQRVAQPRLGEQLYRAFGTWMTTPQIAKHKANVQARRGVMSHIGGSFGSARYEGVGMSTRSANSAISNCCYWGRRTPVGIGVTRGARGWYACVLYR